MFLQESFNVSRLFAGVFGLAAFIFLGSISGYANHPVFVEGNCLVAPAGTGTVTTTGTCGDYDGDSRIGTAEDNDGDNVFGTLTGALGSTGANNNGAIVIVTSGVFNDSGLQISGNVTLEAAPGVTAILDAVLAGDPNNTARQSQTAITIDAQLDKRIIIKNITIRNWATGVFMTGQSQVSMENVKLENNVNFGIFVELNGRLTLINSSIIATGYRTGSAGNSPSVVVPNPGVSLRISGGGGAMILSSTISNGFSYGLQNLNAGAPVCVSQSAIYNNGSGNIAGAFNPSSNGCYLVQ